MNYAKVDLGNNKWVITSPGLNYASPQKACTFAFDTEAQTYIDGKLIDTHKLFNKIKNLNNNQKRQRINNVVWSWQCYDEVNGFFMTNDFYTWLNYQCLAGYQFGWCYNSAFDFSQIDYELLAKGKDLWKPHTYKEKDSHEGYNKGQPWTYQSLHNDMGARYSYKLWVPYHHKNRHNYTHAIEFRDFMKLIPGGLKELLKNLNVKDNEGNDVRKLEMNYQAVNTTLEGLTDEEIKYCENDVKGLYFAIKQFNETIEQQSNNELHIFGKDTNIMTAGGYAKHELLRSLYPSLKTRKQRLRQYQKEHPLTQKQDEYLRKNHLYRGGITLVNKRYKGLLVSNKLMYRYDVNSEYPFAMASINDLIGKPISKSIEDYDKMPNKNDYEAVFVLKSVYGTLKPGCIDVWYDPFMKKFVDTINEEGTHLMFERELNEMLNWYDNFEYSVSKVILWKKGPKSYAPFVNENYALKAEAGRNKNATLKQATKLKLNSSCGKLSERIERVKGHYELNNETGAIHFVRDEVETSSTSMNVAVGALVTSYARCYILSKIREICGPNIKENFVYIDTDSIHCFNYYDKANPDELGALKLEVTCQAIKYIAPKTYIDIFKVNDDGTIDYDAFEIHSKGINVDAVNNVLKKKQKYKRKGKPTLKLIDTKIDYGTQYMCLQAMNVKGGKVLLPTLKYLARMELRPKDLDERITYNNYDGAYFSEI